MNHISIDGRLVGKEQPVYFIADIASNHNGSLEKAKELVHACAESRVDAVKMQNFTAESLVSDYGFKNLAGVKTHQSKWKKSVFESYQDASIPLEWSHELKSLCDKLGISYFTSPYSLDLVKAVEPYVSAYKMGSGDITWHDEIAAMCQTDKAFLLATGASTMQEVELAMEVALANTQNVLLMQCNTEYTAKPDETKAERLARFSHINLKVLETYSHRWPGVPLGLSDHTHGDLTVLASTALYGSCAVEKHFTLDNTLVGQDHSFSMTPEGWKSMAERTDQLLADLKSSEARTHEEKYSVLLNYVDDEEELSAILGSGEKVLEENEQSTVIVQRRSARAKRALEVGEVLTTDDIEYLRPCPKDALPPYAAEQLIGRTLKIPVEYGQHFTLDSVK